MDMDRSILDLNSYREDKQVQGEKHAQRLLELADHYTERHANIREKVRAKHIFRKMLGLPPDSSFSPTHNEAFQDWFLFDYKTIQGSSMFSLFLKNNSRQLTEPDLIQGALFLTSVMEPVEFIEADLVKKDLYFKSFEGDVPFYMRHQRMDISLASAGDLFFIRRIPLIYLDYGLGPVFRISGRNTIKNMKSAYAEAKEKYPELTWRAFLKTNALLFFKD